MDLAEEEFISVLHQKLIVSKPARDIVKKSFDERFKIHESGEIMRIETMCPWKGHLCRIEEEEK